MDFQVTLYGHHSFKIFKPYLFLIWSVVQSKDKILEKSFLLGLSNEVLFVSGVFRNAKDYIKVFQEQQENENL